MKYIIVLSLELDDPEALAKAIKKVDPQSLPGFSGLFRVASDPIATHVEELLDE